MIQALNLYSQSRDDWLPDGFVPIVSADNEYTYLKLEKKWFENARIFQKEDGIWNELCVNDKKQSKNFKKNLTLNGGKCEYEEPSETKGKRFYGFIFDFEFGEFEFYTFDLSPNYDSNFTESVVYTCDKVDPL